MARAPVSTTRRWKLPSFQNTSFMLVFLGLPLAIYTIFVISPFVQAFYYSMTDWTGFSKKMNFVGLTNYLTLLQAEARMTPATSWTPSLRIRFVRWFSTVLALISSFTATSLLE